MHPGQRVGDPAALLLHEHLLQRGAAAAAELDRDVRGVQARARGPARHGCSRTPAASSPSASSASTSSGMSSSANAAGGRLEGEVGLGQTGASACSPDVDRPRVLTDCSVYASVGSVTRLQTPAADAVVVGGGTIGAWCAWFLRRGRAGAGRAGRGGHARQGRQQPGRRHGAGPGRHRGGRPARAVDPRLLPRPARRSSSSTPGFVAQGYCMPCFTDGRGRRGARADRHAAARSGSTCGGSSRPSSTRCNPAVAPGRTLGSSYAPGDGYIDPPRNVLAYTAALVTQRRRGARGRRVHRARDGGRCGAAVHTTRGSTSTPALVVLTGGPAARRGRAAWRAPGSRPAAPGTRSSSPSRTRTWRRSGCRWSSTCTRASTGGPRRAACSGG